jgi:tRNA(Leu) C34 or U34 (ribose-2'-O)-methylase TrmL
MSFKAFKSFAQKAGTRCGVAFEMETVQKNFDGVITAVKGHVLLAGEEGKSVPQEMLWNLKGQAMLIGEQFDLVKEVLIEDVEEDEATLLEVAE